MGILDGYLGGWIFVPKPLGFSSVYILLKLLKLLIFQKTLAIFKHFFAQLIFRAFIV